MRLHFVFSVAFLLGAVCISQALPSSESEDLDEGWFLKKKAKTISASNDLLPIDEAALKPRQFETAEFGCPLAEWFGKVPKNFGKWESTLLNNFLNAWKTSGKEPSVLENDHNYQTLLGQGNTHGFITGTLEIDPSAMDNKYYESSWSWRSRTYSQYKTGLFAERGQYPAVARYSDFGPDGSVQLGRMAVKIAYDPSEARFKGDASLPWAGEMNFLTTETLSTFPLGGFKALSVFAEDTDAGVAAKLMRSYQGATSILGSLFSVLKEMNKGDLLGKTYYSQLPYRIVGKDGKEAAFRFRFRPVGVRRESVGRGRAETVAYVRSYLAKDDVEYAFEITISDSEGNRETVLKNVAKDWGLPYVRVGTLRIPRQALREDGMNAAIASSIESRLHPTDAAVHAIHKMFFFHPVMTSAQHHGVGEIQSFRADFYAQHARGRFDSLLNIPGLWRGADHTESPPYPKFPFCAVDSHAAGWAARGASAKC